MKTYVLLHFERKNDFTVIVKLCMELWDISALACDNWYGLSKCEVKTIFSITFWT